MKKQLKLVIDCEQKRDKFISHLDNLSCEDKLALGLVFVVADSAILLEYDSTLNSLIYYSDQISYLKNNPVISLENGVRDEPLTEWDKNELYFKSFIL